MKIIKIEQDISLALFDCVFQTEKEGRGSMRANGKWIVCAIVVSAAILAAALTVMMIHKNKVNDYDCEVQQDIYFWEFEHGDGENTVFFRYDRMKDEVVEIGRVNGYFHNCVIDEEETVITGVFSKTDSDSDIARYDLTTGAVTPLNITEKINELTMDNTKWWKALVYDEGNKVMFPYYDENGEKWLFYDLAAGQYNIVDGEERGTNQLLAIHDNSLWNIARNDGVLYQYDLEAHTKTTIMDPVALAALAEETGLIAYTKSIDCEEIYLYDMNSQTSKCIANEGMYIHYGHYNWSDITWSSDGGQFFYIKYVGLETVSFMVYDVKTDKSRCIYKTDLVFDTFGYVAKR